MAGNIAPLTSPIAAMLPVEGHYGGYADSPLTLQGIFAPGSEIAPAPMIFFARLKDAAIRLEPSGFSSTAAAAVDVKRCPGDRATNRGRARSAGGVKARTGVLASAKAIVIFIRGGAMTDEQTSKVFWKRLFRMHTQKRSSRTENFSSWASLALC